MSKKREIAPAEALLLAEIFEKLSREDLPQTAVTPMEEMIRELKEELPELQKYVRKKDKKKHSASCSGKCRGSCGARHWKTRRKLQREAYRERGRAARRIRKAELLAKGAEGWWIHQRKMWWQKKVPVTLSKEEFVGIVYPTFNGEVPVFKRYSTSKPVSLDNLLVTAAGSTRKVLFDGKEYSLRAAGYIL